MLPHPRSSTASGGNIIAKSTCKQLIILLLYNSRCKVTIFFLNMQVFTLKKCNSYDKSPIFIPSGSGHSCVILVLLLGNSVPLVGPRSMSRYLLPFIFYLLSFICYLLSVSPFSTTVLPVAVHGYPISSTPT